MQVINVSSTYGCYGKPILYTYSSEILPSNNISSWSSLSSESVSSSTSVGMEPITVYVIFPKDLPVAVKINGSIIQLINSQYDYKYASFTAVLDATTQVFIMPITANLKLGNSTANGVDVIKVIDADDNTKNDVFRFIGKA